MRTRRAYSQEISSGTGGSLLMMACQSTSWISGHQIQAVLWEQGVWSTLKRSGVYWSLLWASTTQSLQTTWVMHVPWQIAPALATRHHVGCWTPAATFHMHSTTTSRRMTKMMWPVGFRISRRPQAKTPALGHAGSGSWSRLTPPSHGGCRGMETTSSWSSCLCFSSYSCPSLRCRFRERWQWEHKRSDSLRILDVCCQYHSFRNSFLYNPFSSLWQGNRRLRFRACLIIVRVSFDSSVPLW